MGILIGICLGIISFATTLFVMVASSGEVKKDGDVMVKHRCSYTSECNECVM